MIKLILKLCFICSFIFVTTFVQAGIIPVDITTITADLAPINTGPVSQDSYITYDDPNTGKSWDIAWASDVNSELYFDVNNTYNTLFSANTQIGWTTMPVINGRLEIFSGWSNPDILELFRVGTSDIFTNAFEYWNSLYDTPFDVNDALTRGMRSEMTLTLNDFIDPTAINYTPDQGSYNALTVNNTFYFRDATVSVPEPSTLMIFALGLIALASKKRLFS
jgi:hypothetical protein